MDTKSQKSAMIDAEHGQQQQGNIQQNGLDQHRHDSEQQQKHRRPSKGAEKTVKSTTDDGKANGSKVSSEPSKHSRSKEEKAKARAEKIARRAREKGATEEIAASGRRFSSSADGNKNTVATAANGELHGGAHGTAAAGKSHGQQQQKSHRVLQAFPSRTILLLSNIKSIQKMSTVGASKDIHREILRLGLQFSSFSCNGGTERCMGMLRAFQALIANYSTPPGTTLSRHLMTHINNQIAYLVQCRPLTVGMGSAIRHVKWAISVIDINLPDKDALEQFHEAIETFIRERMEIPALLIAQQAAAKINDGDVIMTFSRSTLVERTLLEAKQNKKNFRVIVIDTRPLFEGRKSAQVLARAGIPVKYGLISSLSYCSLEATKIVLGANAMFSTGALYGRAGCSLVALAGKERRIPVMVLCESYKFSEKTQLDSFVNNELVPTQKSLSSMVSPLDHDEVDENLEMMSPDDSEMPNLAFFNIMYEIVPASFITVLVSEMGLLPCKSVPVIVNDLKRAELNRKDRDGR